MTALSFTDAELCRHVLAGQTELFAHLVRRHQASVFRVVAVMLRDQAAAEAAVHQAFVSAYEHLDQFQPELPFSAWVKAIARNVVRKEALRAQREAHRLTLYRAFVEASTEETVRAEAEEVSTDEALRACRESLAPLAARAIALRYDEGRSLEEVAAALGRGVGATRQLLFRVRVALRDCLSGRLAGDSPAAVVRS